MEVALDLGTLEHVGLQGVSVYMVGVLKRRRSFLRVHKNLEFRRISVVHFLLPVGYPYGAVHKVSSSWLPTTMISQLPQRCLP